MPSDLSPSEKEEREVERLINKKPAPSRKPAERRGPKYDNRRRRIKEGDSDLNSEDKDLSLNHKVIGRSKDLNRLVYNILIKSGLASNETGPDRAMPVRSATYHGVVQQGNPAGPTNTPYKSYDKRYFGNDHYESILKFARSLMEEDWLKYNWNNDTTDARHRAALDLAVHLADNNLYQSKIDSETYDMLLNRLAGWEHDSFSETVYPVVKGSKRSAAAMSKEHVRNIIRVASELRETDPKAALTIIKNLRALVSSDAAPGQNISRIAQEEQEQEEQEGHTSQQQQGQQQEQQGQQQEGQQEQQGQQQEGQQEQQAQKPGDTLEFKSLSDEDFKKAKEEAKKLLNAKDVEEFMQGFDALHTHLEKTASVRIPLALIIRMAHANPSLRPALMPILVAAKGKMPPFGGKKAPPFGGKKAPPFGGKSKSDKKEPPKGKKKTKKKGKKKSRKSSVNIAQEDLNW
jgi:hypothetical protein